MTLSELLDLYVGGNAVLSIFKKDNTTLIEEAEFDLYVSNIEGYEDDLAGNNPNHCKSTWIGNEPWWNEAKDCRLRSFNVIGGNGVPVELCITIDM